MTTPEPNDNACTQCGLTYVRPLPPSRVCGECERKQRQADAWRETARHAANIPPRFQRFRAWDELTGPEAYTRCMAAVRKFVEDGNSVLALIGTRGTGKTQAAAVAIWQSIESGKSAVYTTALQVLANLKGRYGQESSAESDWLAEWTRPYLLCIDEIAERLDTPHAGVMLTALVDSRYSRMKPTLLLGNVTAEQFSQVAGGSIADRCSEGGGLVRFDRWPSFRSAT